MESQHNSTSTKFSHWYFDFGSTEYNFGRDNEEEASELEFSSEDDHDRDQDGDYEEEVLDAEVQGNCMRRFQVKIKNLSRRLSQWSKEQIENVFDKVREWEAKMQVLEDEYIENDMEDLRPQIHKGQAEHTKWLKREEAILKQRDNIRWLEEGDSTSKYFHSIINERRRRLTLQRVQGEARQWLNGEENIAKEAVDCYINLFGDEGVPELHHLDCISQLIN